MYFIIVRVIIRNLAHPVANLRYFCKNISTTSMCVQSIEWGKNCRTWWNFRIKFEMFFLIIILVEGPVPISLAAPNDQGNINLTQHI